MKLYLFLFLISLCIVSAERSASGENSALQQARLHETAKSCVTHSDCNKGRQNQCNIRFCDTETNTCSFHRKDCSDGNPCTNDYCTPRDGCVNHQLGNCDGICFGANFTVISFDDIAVPDCCWVPVSTLNPYNDIIFSYYWWVAKETNLFSGGYGVAASSSPNFVFSAFAEDLTMHFGTNRRVWSVEATAAWNEGLNVEFSAYQLGSLVANQTFILPYATRTLLDLSGLGPMDELRISPYGGVDGSGGDGGAGEHVTFDDFIIC